MRREKISQNARLRELGLENVHALETLRSRWSQLAYSPAIDLIYSSARANHSQIFGSIGNDFQHEVILFHDGENEEIRLWAENNPLFNRILFNK